jgi:hypothetical protein
MSDSANDELEYLKREGSVGEDGSEGLRSTPPGWSGMDAMVDDVWKARIRWLPTRQQPQHHTHDQIVMGALGHVRTIRRDHPMPCAFPQFFRRGPFLNHSHLLPIGLDHMHAVLAQVRDVEERIISRARDNLVWVRVDAGRSGHGECRFVPEVRRLG